MLCSHPLARGTEEFERVVDPGLVEGGGGPLAKGRSEFVADGVSGRGGILDCDEAGSEEGAVGVEDGEPRGGNGCHDVGEL